MEGGKTFNMEELLKYLETRKTHLNSKSKELEILSEECPRGFTEAKACEYAKLQGRIKEIDNIIAKISCNEK